MTITRAVGHQHPDGSDSYDPVPWPTPPSCALLSFRLHEETPSNKNDAFRSGSNQVLVSEIEIRFQFQRRQITGRPEIGQVV